MGILYPPVRGSILLCDYTGGFVTPEMVKPRPVIVISPQIQKRGRLCTVVPLSTTEPDYIMPYHALITIDPPMPPPFDENPSWLKGDMVNSVSYHRLNFIPKGMIRGQRQYYMNVLTAEQMEVVKTCVLASIF
jgi:mRNA interferase MazF